MLHSDSNLRASVLIELIALVYPEPGRCSISCVRMLTRCSIEVDAFRVLLLLGFPLVHKLCCCGRGASCSCQLCDSRLRKHILVSATALVLPSLHAQELGQGEALGFLGRYPSGIFVANKFEGTNLTSL